MSIQERINILISNLNISKAEFERRVGWGTSAASRVSENCNYERFEPIKATFPKVNLDWLLKGEGNMYDDCDYTDYSATQPQNRSQLFAVLINSLKSKRIITSQKDLAEKMGYNDTYVSQIFNTNKSVTDSFLQSIKELDNDFDMVDFRRKLDAIENPESISDEIDFASVLSEDSDDSDDKMNNVELPKKAKIVPIIPPQAQNSILSYISSNKKDIIYAEPGQMYPAYDLIWRVPSSAMSPCVEKGDILYLKKVEYDQSILNGNVYLIDSVTHGLILRIVHHQNDILECISLSKVIPPVTLRRDEIKDIFSISGMFKFDVPLHKFNIMSTEYKDKEESLKIVLNQNTNLISEMRDQGKRIDTLIDLLKNERKQS